MPSFVLKQPDGKLAIYSTVADDFLYFGMDEAEALEACVAKWGHDAAEGKLAHGISDRPLGEPWIVSDGLNRWRYSLTEIATEHGLAHLKKVLAEINLPDADIPQSATAAGS